ncbi:unnamed protein product, partial [Pelagomonas calceolata]
RVVLRDELREEAAELVVADVEREAPRRELAALRGRRVDGAERRRVLEHEAVEARQDRGYRPHGVPALRVEVAHREAEPPVRLEAARRREHEHGRRPQRVVRREAQPAVVVAAGVGRVRRGGDDVVPLQNIVLEGAGDDVRHGLAREGRELALEAPRGYGRGHRLRVRWRRRRWVLGARVRWRLRGDERWVRACGVGAAETSAGSLVAGSLRPGSGRGERLRLPGALGRLRSRGACLQRKSRWQGASWALLYCVRRNSASGTNILANTQQKGLRGSFETPEY